MTYLGTLRGLYRCLIQWLGIAPVIAADTFLRKTPGLFRIRAGLLTPLSLLSVKTESKDSHFRLLR
jgi:hypothetical protein